LFKYKNVIITSTSAKKNSRKVSKWKKLIT
jgi:hypothetical protein